DPAFGGGGEGPIDDIYGICCATGWHSSSSTGDQTYTLTLPSAQTITGEITVWDRENACCAQRLDGMLFEFFDGPEGTGTLISGTQVDNLAADSFGDINTEVGASFTVPNSDTDTDGDGLSNRYEEANDLDPNDGIGANGAEGDPDSDGSSNLEEFERETNPKVADTDEDGLLDGVESATGQWMSAEDTGTDPLVSDTDGDKLLDGVETNTMIFVDATNTGTSPLLTDSDEDGFLDNRELFFQTDPNEAASRPVLTVSMEGVRSVRITNTQRDWFYIEEFDLFNTADQDVLSTAFGTTGISSEFPGFGGSAEGAIDDVVGLCCSTAYHSSTEEGQQVLTYTFMEPQDLTGDIQFWNRTDGCCTSRLDSMLFEFFDGEEGAGEIIASQQIDGLGSERTDEINSPEGAGVPLIQIAPTGPLLLKIEGAVLAWNSNPIEFFAIEQSPDLTAGGWTVVESHFQAASPPSEETMLTLVEPVASAAFYRIRRVPPPPFLSADFESPAEGWISGTGEVPFANVGETRFAQGVPTSGPGAAHSGEQVFGTNLEGTYDEDLNITLTSSVVDLSEQHAATLSFWYTLEASDGEGAVLEFVDADDGMAILGQTSPFIPEADWARLEFDLAEIEEDGPSVVGKRVLLRFRFLTDGSPEGNGDGFYLDDVLVER
ncbi:MAG: hypothetical protein ACKVHP_20970, partial [Verrucomicrobiales bacterium]